MRAHFTSISMEMQPMVCSTCGTVYYIPQALFEIRAADEDEIFCPNGHRGVYGKPEESPAAAEPAPKKTPSPQEVEALRKRLIELHELEQAEARNKDERKQKKKPSGGES